MDPATMAEFWDTVLRAIPMRLDGAGFKMHIGQTDDGTWVQNTVASDADATYFVVDNKFHMVV
jgi:hypothetical protein